MSMPVQTNNTTFQDGTCPELVKLGVDTFQCPMCQKVGPYHALVPHLQGHQISVVKYGGSAVRPAEPLHPSPTPAGSAVRPAEPLHPSPTRAGSAVRPAEPLHPSPTRAGSAVRPAEPLHPSPTPAGSAVRPAEPLHPSPTRAGSAVRPAEPLHPSPTRAGSAVRPAEPLHPSPTPAGSAVTLAPTASPPLITVATKGMRTSPQKMTGPKILMSRRRNTTCCFCNLILLKKNLKAHIQRQHTPKTRDITANHHLQSVCIERKRGIFAVLMRFNGPAHYIHVKKCTWGEKPQITCQLDTCNRLYDYARRSGQVGFDCQHIQSLVYGPVDSNLPVVLDEEILTDMLINKWFSKNTERECLSRKLAADAEGAPLSFEVNLRKEQKQYFFSVFEPHISSYCRFGRLMVHYNGIKNTWHCPCTKARKSCPHKAIAKWHLHQLEPAIFTKPESCHEDPPETFSVEPHPTVNTQTGNISLYPPEGEALETET
ncbi:uncharacterized protein LOC121635936 [Melanotaenia boesemani]|uniref:uncharacterized protein LOC121635936 n=1 Tax=Melanotaenia boesemani TaxID=1250792 RepID=UPI001C03AB83|nr:uncharacterized protein LOC121635936 [Melanotaenia boesemani]